MIRYSDDEIVMRLLVELDDKQNSQELVEAEEIVKLLLDIGESFVPHLELKKKEPNFIHYFSNYFLPRCEVNLISAMKNELWGLLENNDLTEFTDLMIIDSLIKKGVFRNELSDILKLKIDTIKNAINKKEKNLYILEDYLYKAEDVYFRI